MDDAERYLRRALEEARTGFSAGDPHVAAALNNLAELYRRVAGALVSARGHRLTVCPQPRLRHDFDKAVPLFHEARAQLVRHRMRHPRMECDADPLASQERAYGRTHPSVATTLHNLGGMYTQQGDYPAAMAAYRDALRCKEASLGRLHPEYAATLAHLAEVTALHGRPADAAALLQESLDVMDAIGAGYSRLAQRRMTRLAHLLSASRQHAQAAAVHRRLVQAADMAPSGPEDAGAAMWAVHARVGLADALSAVPATVAEAQQLYSQCLADTRRLCGEAHPLTAACMRRVAEMQTREGSPSALTQAEELLRAALRVLAAQLEAKADAAPDVTRERLIITQEVAAAHLCLAEVLQQRQGPRSEVADHLAAASAALDAAPPGYARDALSVRLRAVRRK